MCSITFVLSIVSFLFQSVWTAQFALNRSQRATAFWAIKPGDQTRNLPENLVQYLEPFVPIDDWSRLELVCNSTSPRTQGIMDLVKKNRNKEITKPTYENLGRGTVNIHMDQCGNIVYFRAEKLSLTDDDIIDLSKLPPTLRVLDLSWNCFTELDLRNLPKTLGTLHLGNNQLTKLDLSLLPSALEYLDFGQNNLRKVNFKNAPASLCSINLANNHLHRIDISSLTCLTSSRLCVFFEGNPDDLEVISAPSQKKERCGRSGASFILISIIE